MPRGGLAALGDRTTQIAALIAIAATALAIFLAVMAAIFRRKRLTLAEAERQRRSAIHASGHLATGLVTEFQGDTVYFTYAIGGIEYMATQDISGFRSDLAPEDDHLLVGPCSLKYLTNNPANSIVICEGWNGLRPARRG